MLRHLTAYQLVVYGAVERAVVGESILIYVRVLVDDRGRRLPNVAGIATPSLLPTILRVDRRPLYREHFEALQKYFLTFRKDSGWGFGLFEL